MSSSRLAPAVASLAVAIGFAVSAVWLPSGPVLATQEYAKKESKECGFCHVSPKGAGPRNGQGREFEANGHRFGVKSWTTDATRDKYLRSQSALGATWYAEAARLLDEAEKEETLPGGLALTQAAREKFRMFPRVWLRNAKTLLAKGDRGAANANVFLAKLESQFSGTDEGKEAIKLLDEGAKDEGKKAGVADARSAEKLRGVLLTAKTEWDQANADLARKLFAEVTADPRGKVYEAEIEDLLSPKPAK